MRLELRKLRLIPKRTINQTFSTSLTENIAKETKLVYGPQISKEERNYLYTKNKHEKTDLKSAIEIVRRMAPEPDEEIEIKINLKTNVKKSNQIVRSSVLLPNTLKPKKVVVICEEQEVEEALKGGALKAGGKELVTKLKNKKELKSIDLVVATLKGMRLIRPLLKDLGKRGKVPNIAQRTVVNAKSIEETVSDAVHRLVTFHTKRIPCISFSCGNLKQNDNELMENIESSAKQILAARPKVVSVRRFIHEVFLKSTHGRCMPLFSARPPFRPLASELHKTEKS